MRSTFHGIEVGKRGIFAQQNSLYTTGHNISNANTPGYSRQVVDTKASPAIAYPGMQMSRNAGQIGTGVDVLRIDRMREDYLDIQYRKETSEVGYWDARQDILSKAEMILNEPSDTGLQITMDKFWTSWQDLSKEPESSSARAVVIERGQALNETLAAVRDGLLTQQKDLNNVINIKTDSVNSILNQIVDINNMIGRIEPHGFQANDLRDQRDVLIDELAKIIPVDSVQYIIGEENGRNSGMLRITSGDIVLVEGRERAEMAIELNEDTGYYDVQLAGQPFAAPRGEMKGLLEARGVPVTVTEVDEDGNELEVTKMQGIIQGIIDHIDTLAVNLAEQINQIHSSGLTMNDINNGRVLEDEDADKLLFFIDKAHFEATGEFISPTNAGNFMIHPAIQNSLDKIAAGQELSDANDSFGTSFEGDGRNASAIASLKFKVLQELPELTTLDDFYRNLIARVGVQVTEAKRLHENSKFLADQVENRRQSVSGVSLDEEMANMIKFQHAYNASARTITTMDEMLDVVVNRMGLVGR